MTRADQERFRRRERILPRRRGRKRPLRNWCEYAAAVSCRQAAECAPLSENVPFVLAWVALKNIALPRALSDLPSPVWKTIALSLMCSPPNLPGINGTRCQIPRTTPPSTVTKCRSCNSTTPTQRMSHEVGQLHLQRRCRGGAAECLSPDPRRPQLLDAFPSYFRFALAIVNLPRGVDGARRHHSHPCEPYLAATSILSSS